MGVFAALGTRSGKSASPIRMTFLLEARRMATISQVTEAVYQGRFQDQMSAGADVAAKSMDNLGASVEAVDERLRVQPQAGRADGLRAPLTWPSGGRSARATPGQRTDRAEPSGSGR